jgi:small subunit ribosomal protein S13
MARIAGVDIPREKRLEISLTYIYGIGKTTAQKMCDTLGLDRNTKVSQLTEDEVNQIRQYVDQHLTIEGDLRRDVQNDIRGQRTHTNARTRKGPKRTVANKKKAVRK